MGAYQPGSDPELDRAVKVLPALEQFLRQQRDEPAPLAQTLEALLRLPE